MQKTKECPAYAAGHSGLQSVYLEVGLIVIPAVAVTTVVHMVHGPTIAFLETLTEVASGFIAANRWMFIHLMVIGIGTPAIHVVVAGSFHTFMEALALGIPVSFWITIPVAAILILILRLAVLRVRGRRRLLRGSFHGCRGGHTEGKCGN